MVTFVLPGYSPHNKIWAEEVAKNLKVEGDIRPVFWDHWLEPEKTFRPKEKAQDIIDIVHGDKVNIIAKSVGTLVAAYVAESIPEKVGKMILCGIPSVSDQRLKIFQAAFEKIAPERIVAFQNTQDPLGSFNEVKEFMAKVNSKIKVMEKPRIDHNYPYYSEFTQFLT